MARLRLARGELARSDGSGHGRARATGARSRAHLRAAAATAAIFYGLGVTEHAQGSTMVMGIANLAMATGNVGREGVGVNPLRGQNNVQGSCDMGSFPHELPGYRHISDAATRALFEEAWDVQAATGAGPAHSEHVRCRDARHVHGPLLPGRGHRPVRPEHAARGGRAVVDGMHRRAGHLPERDGEVRARAAAGLDLPRKGRHVHQRRAPHLARAQGHAAARRLRRLGSDDHARRARSATR